MIWTIFKGNLYYICWEVVGRDSDFLEKRVCWVAVGRFFREEFVESVGRWSDGFFRKAFGKSVGRFFFREEFVADIGRIF